MKKKKIKNSGIIDPTLTTKKPNYWRSSYFVFAYIFLYFFITLLQASTIILPMYFNININTHFSIPMEIWGWGLCLVISGYVGTDRLSESMKTAHMEIGKANMGDPARLRKMIKWTFIIVVENYALNYFYDVNLPIEAITTTFVSCITLYTVGNKAIKATQSVDFSGNRAWANEANEVFIDNNNDGINDHLQQPCQKALEGCQEYEPYDLKTQK